MTVYVEIFVRAPMEALWWFTQTPSRHEQWDLRFSRIEYLPKPSPDSPQRFRYATRLGCGVEVSGEGETVGERTLPDGSATSALSFSSEAPLSIIATGSGYWKYVPTADGVRFLTWYDYRTRFGAAGALFDRVAFRPLIGWATAWSFDRLRLWLEEGLPPAQTLRCALVHGAARGTLAAIFAYHGLVPKLMARHPDELAMLQDTGVPGRLAGVALGAAGMLELAFAASLLLAWRRRWPAAACLALVAVATIAVGVSSPRFLAAAFNPISLNAAVAALAAIDLLVVDGVPSAARCRRHPKPPA